MKLGVEYRTTERYLGKPVYAKLVNAGTPPIGGATTTFEHNTAISSVVRSFTSWGGATTIPYRLAKLMVTVTPTLIIVDDGGGGSDYSAAPLYVCMYYTKNTD